MGGHTLRRRAIVKALRGQVKSGMHTGSGDFVHTLSLLFMKVRACPSLLVLGGPVALGG